MPGWTQTYSALVISMLDKVCPQALECCLVIMRTNINNPAQQWSGYISSIPTQTQQVSRYVLQSILEPLCLGTITSCLQGYGLFWSRHHV
jgi:hypothetical protein